MSLAGQRKRFRVPFFAFDSFGAMVYKSPVRVLQFLSSLHVDAGMAHVVTNYQRCLDPRRVAFDYLCMKHYDDSLEDEVRSLGSNVFCVPAAGKGLPGSAYWPFFKQHKGEYDILHCHPIFGAELLGMAARKGGIRKIIAHSHSTQYSDKPMSARRNRLLTKTIGLFASDFAACSHEAAELFGKYAKQAYIVHNAVDVSKYSFDNSDRIRLRNELGVPQDCLFIGSVGRLAPEKNQIFLLEIARQLKDRQSNFKMIIAGSGPLRGELDAALRTLDLNDRVMLLGSRDDVSELYSAMDVFVLPSLFEGLPVAAVEAQTSGLPCIMSDTITDEALFGRGTCLPLEAGAFLWAQEIRNAKLNDREYRGAAFSQTRSAGFSIDGEAQRLMEFYEGLVGR